MRHPGDKILKVRQGQVVVGHPHVATLSKGQAGPAEGGPNEPASFLEVVGREFNSIATTNGDDGTGTFPWKTGGSEGWDDHEYTETNVSLDTSIAGGPLSSGSQIKFTYPAQTVTAGTSFSPGQVQTQLFQNSGSGANTPAAFVQEYFRFTFYLGPNYQVHTGTGFCKMVFFRAYDGGSLAANGPYIKIGTTSPGPFALEWDLQGTEDNARILTAIADNSIKTETWYEVEVRLAMNTAPGTADGELHTWLREHPNGSRTKIFQETDILMRDVDDTDSSSVFSGVRFDPVWGGQGGTIDPTFHWYLGHGWSSGKESL